MTIHGDDHLYDRSTVPSIEAEFNAAMLDIVAGNEPSTVTHALLLCREPITIEEISNYVGQATWKIEGALAALLEHGWITQITENGWNKFALHPPNY